MSVEEVKTMDYSINDLGTLKIFISGNNSSHINKFSRLLSSSGFDYFISVVGLNQGKYFEIDTSEYWNLDRFMEIVDLMGYDTFYKYYPENYINRKEFRLKLLANIV